MEPDPRKIKGIDNIKQILKRNKKTVIIYLFIYHLLGFHNYTNGSSP